MKQFQTPFVCVLCRLPWNEGSLPFLHCSNCRHSLALKHVQQQIIAIGLQSRVSNAHTEDNAGPKHKKHGGTDSPGPSLC